MLKCRDYPSEDRPETRCHIGELTSFLVVLMAQAAGVSHMKLAVQFWYMRNRGPVDCTAGDTHTHTDTQTVTHRSQTGCVPLYGLSSGPLPPPPWSRPGGCVCCMWASGRWTCRQIRLWTPAAAGPAPRWSARPWRSPCYWWTQLPSESPEDRGQRTEDGGQRTEEGKTMLHFIPETHDNMSTSTKEVMFSSLEVGLNCFQPFLTLLLINGSWSLIFISLCILVQIWIKRTQTCSDTNFIWQTDAWRSQPGTALMGRQMLM